MAGGLFAFRHHHNSYRLAADLVVVPTRDRILTRRYSVSAERIAQGGTVEFAGEKVTRLTARSDCFLGDGLSSSYLALDDWLGNWTAVGVAVCRHSGHYGSEKAELPPAVFCCGRRQHGKRVER